MRILVLIPLLLLGAAPAEARACHRVAQRALMRAVAGDEVTADQLRGCWGSLRQRPAGSENVPVLATSAAILAGLQEPAELAALLAGDNGWPPGEICSELYGGWIATSLLALYDRTRRPDIRRYLRAQWAFFALQATPTAPEVVQYYKGPAYGWKARPLKLRDFKGAFVSCPGMRSAARNGTAYWVERSDLHGLLSAALDLPGWRPRRAVTPPVPGHPQWSLSLTRQIVGRHHGTPAADWGLTDKERALLRAFIAAPSAKLAREIVRWLEPLRPPEGLTRTIVRFRGGGVLALQNHETNAVKKTQIGWLAAGQSPDRAWRIAGKIASAESDRIIVSDPARTVRLAFARFGEETFRITGSRHGWRVENPD